MGTGCRASKVVMPSGAPSRREKTFIEQILTEQSAVLYTNPRRPSAQTALEQVGAPLYSKLGGFESAGARPAGHGAAGALFAARRTDRQPRRSRADIGRWVLRSAGAGYPSCRGGACLPAAARHRCNPGACPNGSQAGGRPALFESPPFRMRWRKASQPGGAPTSPPNLMRLLRRFLSRGAQRCVRNSGVSKALGRDPPGTAPLRWMHRCIRNSGVSIGLGRGPPGTAPLRWAHRRIRNSGVSIAPGQAQPAGRNSRGRGSADRRPAQRRQL